MKRKTRVSGITLAFAASLLLAPHAFAEDTESISEEVEVVADEEVIDEDEEEDVADEPVEDEDEFGLPDFEEETSPFDDVPIDHFAGKAIFFLTQNGYVSGTEDGLFQPDRIITRAQAAKILAEALNLTASSSYKLKATDVRKDHWAYDYFRALEEEGIMTGSSGKLLPNSDVKRAQMAAMLNRAYDYAPPAQFASFKDIDRSFWAYNAINRLAANGITTQAGQAFRPNESTTRAQFCLFIARSMDDRFKAYDF